MAAPSQAFVINKKVQLGLLALGKSAYGTLNSDWQIRNQLQDIDCAYMREGNLGQDHIRARTANRYGDKSRIQDQTVPIVMPQVEAGVSYLSKVFLSGNPIFGVVSPKAVNDNVAGMYDAIMEENGIRGGWVRQLNMFFRDGLKYNLHGLEVNWEKQTVYQPVTNLQFSATEAKPTETVWQGNTIKRMDMYNTFWDTRVAPAEVHAKGEFAGYLEIASRVELKRLIQNLDGLIIKDNIKAALESGYSAELATGFYIPQINPQAILENSDPRNSLDWGTWATDTARQRINYSNCYELMWLYVRIIPSDFDMNVPARNQPQIWKLLIVNQQVVLLAERQTNAHNFLNILIGQPLEDGLNYQTKSYAQNAVPMQEAASALLNATLNSKRRMQFDRLLYNPALIRKEDINSNNPIARIPVKPAAYLKNLSEAVYPFPYNDNGGAMLQEMGLIVQMADKLQGINASQQGQFTKGNRTMHEYDDIMSNSDGRLQTIAMFIEAQVFVPLKEMLKLNIMQYAPAGEIYSRETKEVIKVDPVALRTAAIEFKVSDGYLPSDKLIAADTMQVALQVAGSPQSPLAMELDVVGLFLHYLKTQGARDIEQFRRTVEQQQQFIAGQQQLAAKQQPAAPAASAQ